MIKFFTKLSNHAVIIHVNRTFKLLRNSRKHQIALGLLVIAIAAPLILIFGRDMISRYWDKALSYNVNPAVFVGLLLITFVPYYWSWFLIVRKATRRQWFGFSEAVVINRLIWAPPWVYVYIAGDNYPWWVRPAILLWSGVAVALLIIKAIRTSRSQRKGNSDEESVGSSGLAV